MNYEKHMHFFVIQLRRETFKTVTQNNIRYISPIQIIREDLVVHNIVFVFICIYFIISSSQKTKAPGKIGKTGGNRPF